MYNNQKLEEKPKCSLNTKTYQNRNTNQHLIGSIIGHNIVFPSLPTIVCKRCLNQIMETSDIFMADDKPFCRENCRRIFLNHGQFLSSKS